MITIALVSMLALGLTQGQNTSNSTVPTREPETEEPCSMDHVSDILRGMALGTQENQTDYTSDCYLSVNAATDQLGGFTSSIFDAIAWLTTANKAQLPPKLQE